MKIKKGIVSNQELKKKKEKKNYGRNEGITCITLICSVGGGIIDCSGK